MWKCPYNGAVAELKRNLVFKTPSSMEQNPNLAQLAGKMHNGLLANIITVGRIS